MSTRRPNGTSSIFLGYDGRWHGWVTMSSGSGQRDRRHVSGKSEQVVVGKVRELERERARLTGRLPELVAPTVGEWADHWLHHIAPRRVRQRTLETYQSALRLHVLPMLAGVPLDALQPEHLEQLYTTLETEGLSAATVLRVHRIIGRLLQVAFQRERVRRNVARLVDPPRQRHAEVAQPLDLYAAQTVLAAARGSRNAARWAVALMLGLRQSEALALRWSDVDLERGQLMVRRTQHQVRGGGMVYEEPKTPRARRLLAMPPILTSELAAHRHYQAQERAETLPRWTDNDLVFARPNGDPIRKHDDYDEWCQLLRDAGVVHVRLHDARHTAATLLLAEGVQPRVVMELLGHAQMRTTTDTYSHVMPALAREAAERMNALFVRASTGPTEAGRDV